MKTPSVKFVCNRFPSLTVGSGEPGNPMIQFKLGVFIAESKESVEMLRKHSWYEIYIFEDKDTEDKEVSDG